MLPFYTDPEPRKPRRKFDPRPGEGPERERTPKPLNRMVAPGMVRVRAKQSICEEIYGTPTVFAKGQIFDLHADRVPVIGKDLIEVLAPDEVEAAANPPTPTPHD